MPFTASLALCAFGLLFAAAVIVTTGVALLGTLAFVPFAVGGSRLFHRARRELALQVHKVRAQDTRRPLLLLRSFADDDLSLERRFRMLAGHLRHRLTLEEFVAHRLWALGPVIAIGRPRETLGQVGAAREYVFRPNWQERVLATLGECSWVVSVLGDSDGLTWEYQQVLTRGLHERLVLVFPPEQAAIAKRWRAFRRVFPPAAHLDLPADRRVGRPLVAIFPGGIGPVLFCCKFRNETAYSFAFDELFTKLEKDSSRTCNSLA